MNNILYVGPLNYGGTCLQRYDALKSLGYNVIGIDTFLYSKKFLLLSKIFNRLQMELDILNINKKIIAHVSKYQYDLIWVDKGLIIKPETLKAIKEFNKTNKIVAYSPDDMMNPKNQSSYYLMTVPLYDIHVTTKSYNVVELENIGAKKVVFINNSYDPNVHRPFKVGENELDKYSADVGFIGQFEKDRFESMLFLAKHNIRVIIRGPGWEHYTGIDSNLIIKPGWVLGAEYAKYISNTKINLCFLRKENRDLQTTRSVEIPACGGFMLAERTIEHQYLFEEGKEAAFFSSDDELLKLTSYYLRNSTLREKVAACGLQKCQISGYSNQERLKALLNNITSL